MSIHTVTRDIQIGGLFLATDWISFDDLAQQGAAEVVIEFEYDPGQREILAADPDDSQQGFPPSVTVNSLKLTKDVLFRGDCTFGGIVAGTNLYERLDPGYIADLEDDLLTGAISHRRAA